eukprot:TRINITY_DN2159_c0_g1_i1.p1 TRINITY_DN2159_c0_g1~~TRINITY_DN2159_c0_g1_i1.p1  ORF type:complete len:472 (+),score=160.75 TRINITY_DN2159_c0_g1_i1:52-1416(+)
MAAFTDSDGTCLFNLNDGKRELVNGAEAAQALVDKALAGRDHTAISRICLSNKSYDEGAAGAIAEALTKMTSVTEADISDVIAGRPEDMALRVLTAICGGLAGRSLSLIDVSDNAMGEKGVNACRAALEGQRETLSALRMCNDGLSASAMEAVRDLLVAGDVPTRLTQLHFFNNMSGDGGAKALAQILPHCPELRDLRFSGTRAGRPGSVAVANALAACPAAASGRFVSLDLADNTFGTEGAAALATVLRKQANLTTLSLRDGSLEDEGMTAVAKALRGAAPALRSLDLSANDCTGACAKAVARAIASCTKLEYLGLEENDGFGSAGAVKLAGVLGGLKQLQRLQLGQCSIGTRGAVALAKSLEGLDCLTTLELNGNAISEEGMYEFTEALGAAGKLSALGEMDDNDAEASEEEEEEEEESGEESGEEAEEEPEEAAADVSVDELTAALGGVKM